MSDPAPRALSARESVLAGARAIAPILLGVVPFGIIAGFAAIEIGLRVADAVGFSLLLFAGASQLAAIELLGAGAPVVVVVLTVVVINLRFGMYSASLAPHLADRSLASRLTGAYLLTDQAYAVTITRVTSDLGGRADRFWFYLGAALPMWLVWQVVTVLGALVGDAVPPEVPLGFAVPLAFVALLVPTVTDRPTLAAALTAGGVATLGAQWPANLGMPAGALTGVVIGWTLARGRGPASDRRVAT